MDLKKLQLNPDQSKKATTIFWFLYCFLILGSSCYSQKLIEIPAPIIELKDNKIQIIYDILNSHPSEKYDIQVEIRDKNENVINARTFEGDIGENVYGGMKKRILWDFEADGITMDVEIFVNIYAERMVLPPQVNRASLILQSAAFPGLGLTKVKGKPHWIKGVAAYGCLGGAITWNRMAISTYNDFLAAESAEDADAVYSKSSKQDVISESLAYVAIGIWVTDLIWTIAGTSNPNGGKALAHSQKISFSGAYSAMTRSPVIEIRYRF